MPMLPDIGQTVFVFGGLISVSRAPGVSDGSQNDGSFGTTLPFSVWYVSGFIASILPEDVASSPATA